MPQKVKNGQRVIDHLLDDLKEIDTAAGLSLRDVKFDPASAYNAMVDIRETVAVLRRRIRDDLAPMLERVEDRRESATLPDRVERLEAELEAMRALIEQRAIALVPPRRTGTE